MLCTLWLRSPTKTAAAIQTSGVWLYCLSWQLFSFVIRSLYQNSCRYVSCKRPPCLFYFSMRDPFYYCDVKCCVFIFIQLKFYIHSLAQMPVFTGVLWRENKNNDNYNKEERYFPAKEEETQNTLSSWYFGFYLCHLLKHLVCQKFYRHILRGQG